MTYTSRYLTLFTTLSFFYSLFQMKFWNEQRKVSTISCSLRRLFSRAQSAQTKFTVFHTLLLTAGPLVVTWITILCMTLKVSNNSGGSPWFGVERTFFNNARKESSSSSLYFFDYAIQKQSLFLKNLSPYDILRYTELSIEHKIEILKWQRECLKHSGIFSIIHIQFLD